MKKEPTLASYQEFEKEVVVKLSAIRKYNYWRGFTAGIITISFLLMFIILLLK